MYAEVNVQQFKSMQSLAEQWRIQVAALGGSSSTPLSPAEESRPVISNLIHVESLSHLHDSVPVASPHHEVAEDLELENPQKVCLLNSGCCVHDVRCDVSSVSLNFQHWGTLLLYEPLATEYSFVGLCRVSFVFL